MRKHFTADTEPGLPQAMPSSRPAPRHDWRGWLSLPAVGTSLTVGSGLSFLLVCMLLPMVGPAGSVTPFARANHISFTCYLLLALALSILAIVSKVARRRRDGSPLPLLSMVLCGLCLVLLAALSAGLLRI